MIGCMFFSCKEEGKHDAIFVHTPQLTGESLAQLMIQGKVCDTHDRYTKAGGELSVLFRRALDHRPQAN